MKTYPTYKDSNVDWLGEIPEHWELKKLGAIVQPFSKRNQPNLQVLSVYRDYGVIKKDSRDDNHNATSLDTSNYKVVHNGDLVVNKMKAWQGSMGISSYEGIVSPAYITCNVIDEDVHSHYLHKIIRSSLIIEEYIRISYGVRVGQWDMHWEDFKNVPILIPPKHEQQAIANFLDETCGKLDTVVAQKEKMIALLKERKQALIQKAVTRGLNENVPQKDSGVDWIGDIPENWEVKRLKFICVLNKESLPENLNKKQKINYVDIGSVTFEDGIISTEYYIFQNAPSRARKVAENGDTIVSTVRTYLKAIDFIDKNKSKYVYSTGFAILSPNKNILDKFLYNQVRADAFTEQVSYNSKGMSYPAINSTDLGRIWVCVPPKQEQEKIVNYIDAQSQKIDQAVTQQEQTIVKLKEYKASLIDSCVLGKIKVS